MPTGKKLFFAKMYTCITLTANTMELTLLFSVFHFQIKCFILIHFIPTKKQKTTNLPFEKNLQHFHHTHHQVLKKKKKKKGIAIP